MLAPTCGVCFDFGLNFSAIVCCVDYPFPKRQILDSSKLKKFADNNFKFCENGMKFSKRVEITVGKGGIACYEQFLLFPQCFSKDLYSRHIKVRACLGKG